MGPQWVRMYRLKCMRLGDTEVIVANYQDLSIFPDIGSVIPIYRYLGKKSRTFVSLAYAAPSIIIRDVD